jgi:hypothetical protein
MGPYALALSGACGARSGLFEPTEIASVDAASLETRGAEGGSEKQLDAAAGSNDALPPIDSTVTDVSMFSECPDASATLVYLITQQNELLHFYPPTLTFASVGKLSCPGTGSTPMRAFLRYTLTRRGAPLDRRRFAEGRRPRAEILSAQERVRARGQLIA